MEKVLVGVSGGIDSLAAVLSFIDDKKEVVPMFLILSDPHIRLSEHVLKLYQSFNLKVIVKDERELFQKKIIDYFTSTYKQGMTPNPCALCNREIKFPLLQRYAEELGCLGFSTGHYIKIADKRIFKGKDPNKDQSYFVSTVRKDNLSGFINSPLSEMRKNDVYEIVKGKTNIAFVQKESQEICFIRNNDYASFLEETGNFKEEKGDFLNDEGKKIGEHRGYYRYTVGKRRNLEMGFNKRMYVKSLDSEKNTVRLTEKKNLSSKNFIIDPIEVFDNPDKENYSVKTRYRQIETKCKVHFTEQNQIEVNLAEEIESVTPGQICVIYRGDEVVISGFITKKIW